LRPPNRLIIERHLDRPRERATLVSMVHTTMEDGTPEHLRALHEAYTRKINYLIGAGRDDLVEEIVDAYTDEALQMISSAVPQARCP
jgi:hypothetical protein